MSDEDLGMTWDYVVVGGGSAGCVVAARLAEDPSVSVLMLEAGDDAGDHPETSAADGYKDAFVNDALMHERFTTPQDACGGRLKFAGTGRGLGGSGSINGMVYTRGAAEDYNEWPRGWRWGDISQSFAGLEATLRVRPRPATRWTEACIRGAEEAGFRRSADLNSGDLSGTIGYEPMNYEGDRRRSSYVSFIKDHPRDNLTIITGALVHRVTITDGRATGVVFSRQGDIQQVHAQREVIMAAGALETPKLLMLSGIGPGPVLRRFGIDEILDAPAIGQNLHDHPNVTLFFTGKREVDCHYPQLYGFHRAHMDSHLPAGQSDTCYVFYPARSSLREGTMRLVPGMMLPQRLYRIEPLRAAIRGGLGAAFGSAPAKAALRRVYGIVVILGKPLSRGHLSLASARPQDRAEIDPAYLSDPRDLETLLQGVALARRMTAGPSLSEWGNLELVPGPLRKDAGATAAWIRKAIMTTYHFAGTCRMGEDGGCPVDGQLRLKGIEGLRIADASVVPTTPVSAMNAPSMLVGWRAADLIRHQLRS